MFKKNNKSNHFKKIETVIGPNIKVKGNFNGSGNTVVEGFLEGSLKTNGNVFIGDKANIFANIRAKTARVGGTIEGNISVKDHLEIVSSAKIKGDIQCSTLSIENGAILNGQCFMSSTQEEEQKKDKINKK